MECLLPLRHFVQTSRTPPWYLTLTNRIIVLLFELVAHSFSKTNCQQETRGFSVTFGGRYETSWTEGNLHWGSSRVFFTECTSVIKDRAIPLEQKWYRFDFEYQLPHGLPPSVKEPEGRTIYYSYGCVRRLGGVEIGTYDTHFTIRTKMDLGLLPVIFREPSHRKRFKMYGSDNELSSEQELSGEYTDQGSIGVHEPYVMATLCLSSRAYVIGQHVIADVTIENHLQGTILCTVKLEQVFTFEAHAAREYCGRGLPPLYLIQTRTKATRKHICKPSVVRMSPGSVEAYNCIFQIPKVPPSTPDRFFVYKAKVVRQREPLIRTKYYVTLVISPLAMDEDFVMPLEIKVGTCDSASRDVTTVENSLREDVTPDSAIWDAPPDSEEAHVAYLQNIEAAKNVMTALFDYRNKQNVAQLSASGLPRHCD
ncbi:hypothetical protein LSH36_85g05041 [Paralvinella palmiformis]|uniref:Arrestin C-terminal-like domain-containing protein n=1 Tax=Paralvinella palmiformis TaxID=53620 RepID=A0AAD9K1G2_9ANNE|nr:hypothetical protein LSH36_85g05041 [Paralvinella palmiformis]